MVAILDNLSGSRVQTYVPYFSLGEAVANKIEVKVSNLYDLEKTVKR